MGTESRTENSIKNIRNESIFKIVNLIIKFLLRTVFIYELGQEYVGVNGVFSNILTVLSLTELGIGAAIVYDLYKPIALKNTKEVTQLFKFYKVVYRVIGITIIGLGVLMLPFLGLIIKDASSVNHLSMIFILTVIGTASTYFFAQYTSVIQANQKQSIVSRYNILGSIVKVIIEIILLVAFHSYILYLIVEIIISITVNYIISRKTLKLYPYLNERVENLSKEKIKSIFHNAVSVFSINTALTIVNATDNLLISSMISTAVAGSYSTYMLIVMSVQQLVYTVKTSTLASIGNLCAENDNYQNRQKVFYNLQFMIAWINCIVISCFTVLLTPFIKMWAGDSYILSDITVAFIIINYYLRGTQWSIEAFYNADGLYRYFKIKPWVEVVFNIIISIVLTNKIGIVGIVIGTTIAELLSTFWYDIYITNKYTLHDKLSRYWGRMVVYIGLTITICLICYLVCKNIVISDPYLKWFVQAVISVMISLFSFGIFCYKTEEFHYAINLVKGRILRR